MYAIRSYYVRTFRHGIHPAEHKDATADLPTQRMPFVSDASLSVVVAEIRQALGDDPRTPRYVRT